MEGITKGKSKTITVLSGLLLASLLSLALWNAIPHDPTAKTFDPARVALNRQTLERCIQPIDCLGGFVKWTTGGIARIDNCDRACRPLEVDVVLLAKGYPHSGANLNRIEYIALPGDPEWDAVGKAYNKQFIQKR